MNCIVEFDLIDAGFRHWNFVLSPVLFVVIGAGLLAWGKLLRIKIFGLFYYVAATAFFVGGAELHRNFIQDVEAYDSGEYAIAEGSVDDFQEKGVGSREVKYGTVDGQKFVIYSDAHITNGYTEGVNESAPFSSGRHLKIWHIEGRIIRMESCR